MSGATYSRMESGPLMRDQHIFHLPTGTGLRTCKLLSYTARSTPKRRNGQCVKLDSKYCILGGVATPYKAQGPRLNDRWRGAMPTRKGEHIT